LFGALILSGYGVGLGLATAEAPWLGWVALLPLLAGIRRLTPRMAILGGGVWGASLLVSATALLETAVLETAVSLSPLSAGLLVTVPAIYAGVGSRLTRRIGFSPFVLAVGWIAVEFAMTPIGLRHGLLAGTQGQGALLSTVGAFLGHVFVSFMIAYASGVLLAALGLIRSLIIWLTPLIGSLDPLGGHTSVFSRPVPIRVVGSSRPRAPPVRS
jgi:apolipoprotein N-acyltransferase